MSETTQLVKVVNGTEQAGDFFGVIERLSMMPDIPVDKIKQRMEMLEHVLDRNAKKAYNPQMKRAQSQMPIVPKDMKNSQTNSKYSALETILKHCKPIYTSEGFSLTFYEGDSVKDGNVRLLVDIMHSDGHTETKHIDIPIDDKGIKGMVNKTLTHAKVSSISYGKSNLVRMVFNIPTGEDDDGNLAGGSVERITDKQANEIADRLLLVGADIPKFLEFMKVDEITDIRAGDFKKADAAIKAKERKK
jgi:hypothetical protein